MYLARDIPAFVMYCVNGESGSSLLIESTDSMINKQKSTPGKYFSDVDNMIALLNEASHPIVVTDSMNSAFDVQVRQPYLAKLIQNFRDRFPAVEIISTLAYSTPFN